MEAHTSGSRDTAGAMSQEDVETFRRGIEAMNRRDVEALLPALDPGVEWHMTIQALIGGEAAVYHGHEGVREYFRDMDEAFSDVHADYPDVRDLGDRLLALGSFRVRGRESGAEVESQVGALVDMKEGRATRVLTFLDPREALEAAGLSE